MKSPESRRITCAMHEAIALPGDDRAIEHLLDTASARPFDDGDTSRIMRIAMTPVAPPASALRFRRATVLAAVAAAVVVGIGIALPLRQEHTMPPSTTAAASAPATAEGRVIETDANEKRLVELKDGSVVYIDQRTRLVDHGDRTLTLERGRLYIEVAPGARDPDKGTFKVRTPTRTVTALGTRFALDANASETSLMVTQGKVRSTGTRELVHAGQQLRGSTIEPLPNAALALDWTRELRDSKDAALVPASRFAGGAVVVKRADEQESRLSLRRYHVDVHIEDGFARTTIDHVYFNHMHRREEGTFYFPLPPDASLSRLAMYVNGRLMEGGMAERGRARNVFETIRYQRKDPALLEWVDGSTFKMRVFPLEPRSEKRIILSYTQKLAERGGADEYRFPAGHNFSETGTSSVHVRLKNSAMASWESPSHAFAANEDGNDLVLSWSGGAEALTRDVVLAIDRPSIREPRFATFEHEEHRYFMLRTRPAIDLPEAAKRRDWIFLFETPADRNAILAEVQMQVARSLLENAGHDDTFSIVAANTAPVAFRDGAASPIDSSSIAAADSFLGTQRLIGALDLDQAFRSAAALAARLASPTLVHLGAGNASIGPRSTDHLLSLLPENLEYAGVGVGKKWNRQLMHAAASKTGGYATRINPDEPVSWRAFQLSAALKTARLAGIRVMADANTPFLLHESFLLPGEELMAVARLPKFKPLPTTIRITASLNGESWAEDIPLARPVSDNAGYLPRIWARLEIDRMLAEDTKANRSSVVKLSKEMYVMSPFTSLLVLENDAMYSQYKIDRGRKDHWARYPAELLLSSKHTNQEKNQVPGTTTGRASEPAEPSKPERKSPAESWIIERELARRQASIHESKDDIREGKRLLEKEDLEGAIRLFRSAIDRLPEAPLTHDVRSEAITLFSDACVDLAHERALEGRRDSAHELLEAVLSDAVDPDHRRAKKILVRLNDPDWYNWAITPEHVAEAKEIDRALRVGHGFYDIGDFDNAEKHFNSVLRLDKTNIRARRALEEVEIARQNYHIASRDHTRARMLRQVDETWEIDVPLVPLDSFGNTPKDQMAATARSYLADKLNRTIVPRIRFTEATIHEAVAFLRQKSIEHDPIETDPTRKGIRFEVESALSVLEAKVPAGRSISLALDNVSLSEAIRRVTEEAGMGYSVEPHAVIIFEERKELTHAQMRAKISLLVDDEAALQSPVVLRFAHDLALKDGEFDAASRHLEKALSIEHARDDASISYPASERDHRTLFASYLRVAEAMRTLGTGADEAFAARILLSAERWRAFSSDADHLCSTVARVLYTLGEDALGWQYLSTLVALHPNESRPFLAIATELERHGEIDAADSAYAEAFRAEKTNPEILLKHAQFLNRHERNPEALELYRKIAHGKWQERFGSTVSGAQRTLRESK